MNIEEAIKQAEKSRCEQARCGCVIVKDEKVIVWAHNVHITKSKFKMTGVTGRIKGMGYILNQELRGNLISIGASFNKGDYQNWNILFPPARGNTLDGILAKLNLKFFLIDLKAKTDNAHVVNWLNTDKVIRAQGVEMTCIPVKSFDAIYFVNHISRTNPNQKSLERFRNSN